MMKLSHRFLPLRLIRRFSQSLVVGAFVTTILTSNALLVTLITEAQSPPPLNPNELRSYARALLAMEPQRQQAFDEIKKIVGDKDVPQIVCYDKKSFNDLPSKARDIAVNYCNRSHKIVEDNGLSIDRFNKITVEIQNNEDLKRQIYNLLLRLQKNPESR